MLKHRRLAWRGYVAQSDTQPKPPLATTGRSAMAPPPAPDTNTRQCVVPVHIPTYTHEASTEDKRRHGDWPAAAPGHWAVRHLELATHI
jgi:hypothetical protein